MAQATFACHHSGAKNPTTCAGFLLRGADHNLSVRMAERLRGADFSAVTDGGHELHRDYYDMAVANGVDPEDPILKPIRRNRK
jgi:hypothetical protein